MTVSEAERTELANNLVVTIGEKSTETLMKCIILEGREQLATKDDLRVLASELRAEMSELRGELRAEMGQLRGYIDLALAKQTRFYIITMVGSMLTIWGTLLVQFLA